MKAAHCKIFGYVIAAALMLMGQCVSHTLIYRSHTTSTSSSLTDESLHNNFVEFDSAPDQVINGSVVNVHYQCSRPCRLAMEVVVSTLMRTEVVVFRKKWTSHRRLRVPRMHLVQLRYPPSVVYRRDLFNRHTLDAQNATVRAWLDHLDNGYEPSAYHSSPVRTYKVLQTLPLSDRPAKPPTECLSWAVELMWQLTRDRIYRCPHESGTVNMLKFPLSSTGELYGVVRKFHPFMNRDLERARIQAVKQPSVTVSVWVYLLKWCDSRLCGIIHHVDRDNRYDSPLMQLTDGGDLLIQVRLTAGGDEAFRSHAALPLWTWIRLDCSIHGSKVTLNTMWDNTRHIHNYEFQSNIHYDDTSGYYVIGGSRHMPGIHGYFGTIKYYRFGTEKVINPLLPERTLESLDKTHRECEKIKGFTAAFLQGLTESHLVSYKGLCRPHYVRLWAKFRRGICGQAWTWETQLGYSDLFSYLKSQEKHFRTASWGKKTLRHLGRRLFKQAVAMFNVDGTEIQFNATQMALLKVSSCFSYHKASLLLATIHLAGLGDSMDQQQGHVYSLIGALGDDRLALMHVGYKHTQGIDGFPKDFDMAYGYYANVGAQSSIDSERVLEKQQLPTEYIHLSNKEGLKSLTHEKGDVIQFLKFQAERGDVESQKLLARILFWGENGVSKDVASAVKWFERSAMQMDDPLAMYDYAILLIKGQGVKKNMTRGLQLLQKAAAMGSARAVNGLGWYHATKLDDHKTALKYFHQAALNGSRDGIFNLGVYHLNGKNPDDPQLNETAAFRHFLNASGFGHIHAAVEAARYLSIGSLEGVPQDVERAVIMLKRVCERNGHLGHMIRGALQAYLQGSWGESLVKYIMVAETGLGVAQNNAAHLCEELKLSYGCQWRYHNQSVLNYDPHPSGLLKMGDYYYYSSGRRGDSLSFVGRAVSMYIRAGLAGSPQGMFNLVVLAQEGVVFPPNIRGLFNVSTHDELDILVENILKRCIEIEDEDAVTPCSLALLRVQMGKAWRKMSQNYALLSLAYTSLLSFIITMIIVLMQICLEHLPINVEQINTNGYTAERGTGTLDVNQNGTQDDLMRNEGCVSRTLRMAEVLRLTLLKGTHRLQQTSDLALTVSGVCLCALCTTLLCHLL